MSQKITKIGQWHSAIYDASEMKTLKKNLPDTLGSVQFVIFNMLPDLTHTAHASKPCQ
jgi:hypothetical protein